MKTENVSYKANRGSPHRNSNECAADDKAKRKSHSSRQTQLSFARVSSDFAFQPEHGGSVRKGKRKTARPFTPKLPLHLVLKIEKHFGRWFLTKEKHARVIKALLKNFSKKYQVQILEFANAGDHLHLLVKAKTRDGFQSFLRRLTGALTMKLLGAQKGKPAKLWRELAYSRLVTFGRDLKTVVAYLKLNATEGKFRIFRELEGLNTAQFFETG